MPSAIIVMKEELEINILKQLMLMKIYNRQRVIDLEMIFKLDVLFINMLKGMQTAEFDNVMSIAGALGNKGAVWFLVAIGLIIGKKYRKYGMMMVISMLVGYLIGEFAVKEIVGRARPFTEFKDLVINVKKPSSYSFPSSSTLIAFAASGIIMQGMKKYSKIAVSVAALIGFSRAYFFVHYLSDVVAGAVIGLAVAKAVYEFSKIIERRLKKKNGEEMTA